MAPLSAGLAFLPLFYHFLVLTAMVAWETMITIFSASIHSQFVLSWALVSLRYALVNSHEKNMVYYMPNPHVMIHWDKIPDLDAQLHPA